MDKLYEYDKIKLSWCKKHKEWWVMNCPDCMVESVDEEWKQAGYRKLPEDKPLLLSDAEIRKTYASYKTVEPMI